MQPQSQPPNTILIRHGQSSYNNKAAQLREKLNIGATWAQYRSSPEFMEFKYSFEMMDCGLSEDGRQQCRDIAAGVGLANMISRGEIGAVVVSPLWRALESCSIVAKDLIQYNNTAAKENKPTIPIIVDPLFTQSLRCACDVSYNLFRAKKQFPFYDFSKIQGRESVWYIENQEGGRAEEYKKLLIQGNVWPKEGENKGESKEDRVKLYQQTAKFITKYMQKTYNFQHDHQLLARSKKALEALKKYIKNYSNNRDNNNGNNNAMQHTGKKVLVISHFYLLGNMLTLINGQQFTAEGKPARKVVINNAEPLYAYVDIQDKCQEQQLDFSGFS